MSSSSQVPSLQLMRLQVLHQHAYLDLQHHVLYRRYVRQQSAQLFLHRSSPCVQKFREYRALIPRYLVRHLGPQGLRKLNPSALQQVVPLNCDHLNNARRQAIALLYPNKSHLVPKHLHVPHRNQMSSSPLIRLQCFQSKSLNLPKKVSFHIFA